MDSVREGLANYMEWIKAFHVIFVITWMSGMLYLAAAIALGVVFLGYAIALIARYSDDLARRTFRYSILYLAALFSALLLDHYWR